MAPRAALLAATIALLAATASAAVAPAAAKGSVYPVSKSSAAAVSKGLASPGIVVLTSYKLAPGTDVDKWIEQRRAFAAKAHAKVPTYSILYVKGGVPAASLQKKGDEYLPVGAVSTVPDAKDYAAYKALTATDPDYAATQKAVVSTTRVINLAA